MDPLIHLVRLLQWDAFLDLVKGSIPCRLDLVLMADTLDNATCQVGNLRVGAAGNPYAILVIHNYERSEYNLIERAGPRSQKSQNNIRFCYEVSEYTVTRLYCGTYIITFLLADLAYFTLDAPPWI
jgi:hypothetical protein